MIIPTELSNFIGLDRRPHITLHRLQEEGLLREDADEKEVFAEIVDMFLWEIEYVKQISNENKRYLKLMKRQGPIPADPCSLSRRQRKICDDATGFRLGERRAHRRLVSSLRPFLSPKGIEFSEAIVDFNAGDPL